jgi:hypothetical protein
MKKVFLFLAVSVLINHTYGQTLPCEEFAGKVYAEIKNKSIWSYDTIDNETYYCLGQYFAIKDIEKKKFLIHTFGDYQDFDPCIICKYNSYGFNLIFHGDFMTENITYFIDGYNEISMHYLKSLTGDSMYRQLFVLPDKTIDIRNFLFNKLVSTDRYITFNSLNDSSLIGKIKIDSLFGEHLELKDKVYYKISTLNKKDKLYEDICLLNSNTIENEGFVLKHHANEKSYIKLTLIFKELSNKDINCLCDSVKIDDLEFVVPVKCEE